MTPPVTWKESEIEDQGFVIVSPGHIDRTADTLADALAFISTQLAEPLDAIEADFALAGRWVHAWRGGDPTGDYAWLTCSADGTTGFTHDCRDGCFVAGHLDDDDGHLDDVDDKDCRCSHPACRGPGAEIIATDVEAVTVVDIDAELLWRLERAARAQATP